MLPETVDPTRQKLRTSYGHRTTPEQALAVAVILQAVEDLGSEDETERFEAHEFFLQPKGPWAEMRRFYFQAVSLDEEWLHAHFAARLEPPERPDKKWTFLEIGEVLPTNRAFTAADLCSLTGLVSSQVASRLQHLRRHGRLVTLAHGVYCVPEFEATWRSEQAKAIQVQSAHTPFKGFDVEPVQRRTGPTQQAILDCLRDGRETIREIGWDMEMDYNTLKCALDRLIARGLVEKDGQKYRLVPQSAVAT